MLLAIDIGNSSTKFGVFDGDTLVSKFSIHTGSADDAENIADAIGNSLDLSITSAILCSVVPNADQAVQKYVESRFGIVTAVVDNSWDLSLKINYQPLSAAGTDRLVAAFSAADKYGAPVIVCSLGTAFTIDAVNDDREYLGGIIAPGVRTMAESLHLMTAKLPVVEIEKPANIFGNTTVDSIRSGVYFGSVALIEGIVARMKGTLGMHAKTVATGGYASMLAGATTAIDAVDDILILDGLRRLSERSRR